MKTVVTQMLEKFNELQESKVPNQAHLFGMWFFHNAESMLKEEKEAMCKFQSDGQKRDFWVKYSDNEDCFDKTFNNEER